MRDIEHSAQQAEASLIDIPHSKRTACHYLLLTDAQVLFAHVGLFLNVETVQNGFAAVEGEDEVAIIPEDELLITRNSPFKVAVVPALTTKIIANHNTYMIELDKKKLHPVYVMLYLQSNQGKKQLEYRATGDRISILSRIAINDIEIPMIPMEEQLKIVEQYQALKAELVELQKQEKALRSRIESIMEGEN